MDKFFIVYEFLFFFKKIEILAEVKKGQNTLKTENIFSRGLKPPQHLTAVFKKLS